MQESEKSWAPLLQDVSALSNIDEWTKKPEPEPLVPEQTRLHPETDSDLQPQKKKAAKKNIRLTKQKVQMIPYKPQSGSSEKMRWQ